MDRNSAHKLIIFFPNHETGTEVVSPSLAHPPVAVFHRAARQRAGWAPSPPSPDSVGRPRRVPERDAHT